MFNFFLFIKKRELYYEFKRFNNKAIYNFGKTSLFAISNVLGKKWKEKNGDENYEWCLYTSTSIVII